MSAAAKRAAVRIAKYWDHITSDDGDRKTTAAIIDAEFAPLLKACEGLVSQDETYKWIDLIAVELRKVKETETEK